MKCFKAVGVATTLAVFLVVTAPKFPLLAVFAAAMSYGIESDSGMSGKVTSHWSSRWFSFDTAYKQ